MELFDLEWWDKDQLEILRVLSISVAAAIGIFIGLPLAIWRSYTAHKQANTAQIQARLAEKGQNIDRYQKGAAILSDPKTSVRQAGVLGLRELVQQNPEDYNKVVAELLSSFVTDRSSEVRKEISEIRKVEEKENAVSLEIHVPSDIQSALSTLGSIDRSLDQISLNLKGAYLLGAIVENADLTDARFDYADLRRAGFKHVSLARATFIHADLNSSFLINSDCSAALFDFARMKSVTCISTNFSHARFFSAYLEKAEFTKANLQGANFNSANLKLAMLSGANLENAVLTHTDFQGANLIDADLAGANLTRANFSNTDLGGANLTNARLKDANLSGANLDGTDLLYANLQGATINSRSDLDKASVVLDMANQMKILDEQ